MTNLALTQWLVACVSAIALAAGAIAAGRAYGRRSRRRALLARIHRIALQEVHQVLVPDGMGGHIHIDHVLLTPRGVLILDTRRVQGVIFGGDQMSEWTVLARGRRYTFENPQPALYDRIAAVKAVFGVVPVDGRLVFSNLGKFTKGKPKCVTMVDGLELEFPRVDPSMRDSPAFANYMEAWRKFTAQLQPSPHSVTDL